MISYFAQVCILKCQTMLTKEVFFSLFKIIIFHFPSVKRRGFLWRTYQIFVTKIDQTICQKIFDHILCTNNQMVACKNLSIHFSSNRQISTNLVGTRSNLNCRCLIVCSLFLQNGFLGTKAPISSKILQNLQDFTYVNERSCPLFWPHFETHHKPSQ